MLTGPRYLLGEISRGVNWVAEWLTIALTILFSLVTIMQVFTRYALEMSLPWPEETARYALVWVAFITASILTRECEHVAVLFFRDKVHGERAKHLLLIFIYLVMTAFVIVLTVYGTAQCIHVIDQRWASVPELSMFWVFLACPLGGAFMLVQLLKLLLDEAALTFGRSEE